MTSTAPRTAAILNQKGGVGKTTTTLGLASASAARQQRALVVDLDPQGASTWVLGHDPTTLEASVAEVLDGAPAANAIVPSTWADTIDVMPASARLQRHDGEAPQRLRAALTELDVSYDAVLIDCPPSLGNLTTGALAAARHAVVVVEPSALGLRGIGGVADVIDEVWDSHNPDLELSGVILNRVPAVSGEAERRISELARIVGRQTIWQPSIPQRVVLNQAVGERRSVHSYGSRARGPIEAFDKLWAKLLRVIKRG